MNELEKLAAFKEERERLSSLLDNVYRRMDLFSKCDLQTAEYYSLEQEGLTLEKELRKINVDIEALEALSPAPNKGVIYPNGIDISTATFTPNVKKDASIYSVWDYESGHTAIDVLRKMRDNALQMVEDYTDEEFNAKLKKDRYTCLADRLADAILYASELD